MLAPFPVPVNMTLPSSSPSRSCQPPRKRQRPSGLWKRARAKVSANWVRGVNGDGVHLHSNFYHDDTDEDDDIRSVSSSSTTTASSKRRHIFYSDSDDEEHSSLPTTQSATPPPLKLPITEKRMRCCKRFKPVDIPISPTGGVHSRARETCNYEDWEQLKKLFSKASESYENAEPSESLPLLRAVIRECHRFLLAYHDPSVLFTQLRQSKTRITPSEDRAEWFGDEEFKLPSPPLACAKNNCCIEIPTAFHALMGTALFLSGNIVAQDQSLVQPGEPDTAIAYWLAALDIFETGENLPSRTNGHSCCSAPEDWRMAIVWGRALVCLADETLKRCIKKGESLFAGEDPLWPKDSPFATIAARRPPLTRRMTLSSASADDLMMLAMDQFSRGIFHMPHSKNHSPLSGGGPPVARPQVDSFSRAKELFTIASEVLAVSERMDNPSERSHWAAWADSVFNQMKMEADMDIWRIPIVKSRARCQLIIGTARSEEFEDALERGDSLVYSSEEAMEARDSLEKCIEFFERAKMHKDEPFEENSKPLFAEALIALANLTEDETKREELYARAQAEGGDSFSLDCMDESP